MRLLLLAVTFAAVVASATPAAGAENGIVRGVVTNQTTGRPASGAEVILAGADQDGSGRIERSVTSDEKGRYVFDELPSDPNWLFVIDAEFDGGRFPGSPFGFPRNERPILDSSLKVWNTTSDPKSIIVDRNAMFVLPSENSVGVVESVRVLNHSNLAYVGRGDATGEATTTFGFGLPAGASEVTIQNASLDIPELIETDFGFGINVALPPNESEFTYSYRVPADGLTYVLSKTALYPTADLLVFAGEPLEIESDRLRAGDSVTLEGQDYRRWYAPGMVDAGDTVIVQATAEGAPSYVPLAIGAGVVALLLVGAYLLFMRKPRSKPEVIAEAPPRDALIAEIASLDLAFETGSLPEEQWAARRSELKARLVELETT